MQVSTNGVNAYVVHDNIDAHYTLFYDDNFKAVTCRGWNNPQQGNWQDDYAITLTDGDRTFGFMRESLSPDQLRVNGQDFDLRQGRALVLNPDGTARQLPLFPSLAVAQKADVLASLVQAALTPPNLSFGPVIERVTAVGNKVVIEGQAPAGGQIAFYSGSAITNGWSSSFPQAGRFTATLEQNSQGLQCRVQSESGTAVLMQADQKTIGDIKLSDGELHLYGGKPHQAPDGTWSANIGLLIRKPGSLAIPLRVSLSAAAAPALGFGPVMEQTLPMGDNDGPTQWLNLDTGVRVEKPRGWWLTQAVNQKERNTLPGLGFSTNELGLDATAIGLVFLGTIPSSKWDAASAGSIAAEMERQVSEHLVNSRSPLGDSMIMAAADAKLPKTYLFKTPKRTIGLLQITGFTENPPGVKLRYKLVRPPASASAPNKGFIRKFGTYSLDGNGGGLALTPSTGGRVSFALTTVEGASRENVSLPDFFKQDGWFVYVESAERVWIFDGIRQLDVVAPDGRYSAGDLGVRALCPAAVWDAVPETVRKFYRETQNTGFSRDLGEPQKAAFGSVVERVVTNFPFRARFQEGSVELLGISEFQRCTNPALGVTHDQSSHPTNKPWWQPNGLPLNRSFRVLSGSFNAPGRDIYELALKVDAQNNSLPNVKMESLPNARCYPAGISGGGWANRPEDRVFKLTLSCDSGLKQAAFRVGVAVGPWQTMHKFDFSSGATSGGEWGSTLCSVVTAGNEVVVTCNYEQQPGCQMQLVALGPKGEIEPERQGPSQGVGKNYSETLVFNMEVIKDAALYLQRRPYQWVEFRDVSLHPGYQTEVKVKDGEDGNQPPVTSSRPNETSGFSFGPVVERTMTSVFGGQTNLQFLDFETGRFHQPPPELAKELRSAVGEAGNGNLKRPSSVVYDWLKQTGVDAVAGNLESETELWFIDRSYAGHRTPPLSGPFDSVVAEKISSQPMPTPGIYDPLQMHRAPLQRWHYDDKADIIEFRTREGNAGILEVAGLTENPRGVKVRYKLVQNIGATAKPVSMPPTAASTPGFGPVMMQLVQSGEAETNVFLNLDTGELLTPPKDLRALFREPYLSRITWQRNSDARAEKMQAWARNNGAHLMVSSDAVMPERLEIREVAALPMNVGSNAGRLPFDFDRTDAKYLMERFQPMLDSTLESHDRMKTIWRLQPEFDPALVARRDTYCFKTRKGSVGVLQILNTEQNPRGVRVRYKLMQKQAAQPVVESAMPTDGVYFTYTGDMTTVLELNGGRFRYWVESDVKEPDEPEYPLSGPFHTTADTVALLHEQCSQPTWTFRSIDGHLTLWRPDALAIPAADRQWNMPMLTRYGSGSILISSNKRAEELWERRGAPSLGEESPK